VPGQPPADEQDGDRARVRRGVDSSAIGTVLMGLPWFVYSAIVIGVIGGGVLAAMLAMAPVGGGLIVVVPWLATGALAFHRPTEAFVARHMFHLRRPSPREQAYLDPVWQGVTAAAGVDTAEYQLWVEQSNEPNASASLGHNVGVTTAALTHLPPRQLKAVLAHELGHHIGGHAWASLLMWWYSLPARIFTRVVAVVVGGTFRMLIGMFPLIGSVIALFVMVSVGAAALAMLSNPIFALLAALAVLSPLAAPWLARQGELRADRMAVDLGFGPELIESFNEIASLGLDPQHQTIRGRMFASHPATDIRIELAQRHMGQRK
jgi:STE24 endopeptidase